MYGRSSLLWSPLNRGAKAAEVDVSVLPVVVLSVSCRQHIRRESAGQKAVQTTLKLKSASVSLFFHAERFRK